MDRSRAPTRGARVWPPASCVAAALTGALACSSFEGASDVGAFTSSEGSEASEVSSTASLAPGLPGQDWSCLSGATAAAAAPVPATGAERVVYSLQLLDLATQQVSSDIQARACGLADVECARPVAGPVFANRDGWLDLPLFEGFTGYLEVTGPNVLPGLLHITEPLTAATVPGFPYLTVALDTLEALGRLLGVELELSQGLISLRVFDCQGSLARGVAFSKAGPGVAWYFVGGLPSITVAETGTDGMGGFLNVPSGLTQLDVKGPQGLSLVSPRSMVIRPGWMSSSFVFAPGSR